MEKIIFSNPMFAIRKYIEPCNYHRLLVIKKMYHRPPTSIEVLLLKFKDEFSNFSRLCASDFNPDITDKPIC